MALRKDQYTVDDLGRVYLTNDAGEAWDGPYDTLQEAEAADAHWARKVAQEDAGAQPYDTAA